MWMRLKVTQIRVTTAYHLLRRTPTTGVWSTMMMTRAQMKTAEIGQWQVVLCNAHHSSSSVGEFGPVLFWRSLQLHKYSLFCSCYMSPLSMCIQCRVCVVASTYFCKELPVPLHQRSRHVCGPGKAKGLLPSLHKRRRLVLCCKEA